MLIIIEQVGREILERCIYVKVITVAWFLWVELHTDP